MLELLLAGVALLLLMPVTVFFFEVLLGSTARAKMTESEGERLRLAVVMPAHNEASIICGTLRSILPQLKESDRLIVVADNCSDETATIAAAEGAEVVVREDPNRRGKGYALDYGVRHLEGDAPSIVVVIDADCQVAAGSIDRLARACARSARPVQALYLMFAGKDAGLKMRIAEFSWVVKNWARPAGLLRAGLPCQLMGTGMAFPWSCISSARLATGHIVEDLKLGIDLARAGAPPLFCPEALVTSNFPPSAEGIRGQRARWEHGHLSVILSDAPRLLLESALSWNANLFALALDLSVPPLSLLTLLVSATWVLSVLLYVLDGARLPIAIASAQILILTFSVLLAWIRYGRRIVSLGTLALAILYALWKIPLYIRFTVARQLHWVRSKRDKDGPTPGN